MKKVITYLKIVDWWCVAGWIITISVIVAYTFVCWIYFSGATDNVKWEIENDKREHLKRMEQINKL